MRCAALSGCVSSLERAFDVLHTRCGWPFANMHLFGFADGAHCCVELALRLGGPRRLGAPPFSHYPYRVGSTSPPGASSLVSLMIAPCAGGVVCVAAGMLPELLSERQALDCAGPLAGPHSPLLMLLGELDTGTPSADADAALGLLRARRPGIDAEVRLERGKGHGMIGSAHQAEMRHLMSFWARTLSSRPLLAAGEEVVELSRR